MANEIRDQAQMKRFIEGGKATFTLENTARGSHMTFTCRKSQDRKVTFVSVKTDRRRYIGMVKWGKFMLTRKSDLTCEKEIKAFQWAYERITNHTLPLGVTFRHNGKCGVCGRKLTTPESIELGIGPVCKERVYG